jgi:hypothetical protein
MADMKNILKDAVPADLPSDTLQGVETLPVSTNAAVQQKDAKTAEKGGPKGLEPTRYGDWEKQGKCVDF